VWGVGVGKFLGDVAQSSLRTSEGEPSGVNSGLQGIEFDRTDRLVGVMELRLSIGCTAAIGSKGKKLFQSFCK